jgi:DegV family protein with EDD domain
MTRVAIVTDTNASLPLELTRRMGIFQVPQTVIFGDESFEACTQINDAELFARIDREGKLPTTAAPAPGRFAQEYEAAFAAGAEQVICFSISSELSATYKSAIAACDLLPGKDITVVDSQTLSIGQGFMVLAAAEAARAGLSKSEILAIAEDVRERSFFFATLPTLKYLQMSGRVSYLAAGMATMLAIKPILTIKDGRLVMLERVRTWQKALKRVVELADRARAGRPLEQIAIGHVNAPEEARQFQTLVCETLPCLVETIFTEINPGMSPHSGSGVVGVGFVISKNL